MGSSKVLIITGSTGIAAATAQLAEAEGHRAFLVDEDTYDLREAGAAARASADCIAAHGRIDGLFNAAGISGRRLGDGPLHECTEEGWDAVMASNLRTTFLASRAVLRGWLAANQSGAILNMSSVLANSPEPERFQTHAYAASKAAIDGLTKSMAAYYAPFGIRVNAIAPGLVKTPMSARAQANDALMEYVSRKQPLSRGIIEARDVARAALFLLTDGSRFITGETLAVDGGWKVTSI